MSPLTTSSLPRERDERSAGQVRASGKDAAAKPAPSISSQVDLALASFEQSGEPDAQAHLLAVRARRVKRLYSDLAKAGQPVRLVGDLREPQARALLAYWRAKGNRAATVRSDWSVLRTWLADLGMAVAVKPLKHYWKDVPRAPTQRAKANPLPVRHSDVALVACLGDGKDRTHYFVERACQTFRMSVQEAFTVSAATLGALLDGKCPNGLPRALDKPLSEVAPEAKTLAQELRQFLAQEGRATLLWPNVSMPQGIRRHENHLAYVRRRRSRAAKDPP